MRCIKLPRKYRENKVREFFAVSNEIMKVSSFKVLHLKKKQSIRAILHCDYYMKNADIKNIRKVK